MRRGKPVDEICLPFSICQECRIFCRCDYFYCGHRRSAAGSRTIFLGDEMADDRAVSRRKGERRCGRAGKSGGLLFWRGRRGSVEDDGWRDGVETDFRQRASSVNWSDDAGAFESEDHLRGNRHQYDFFGQQLWRWSLQVRGWRGELAARGTRGHAAYWKNPGRSAESGSGAGRGDGPQFRAERRARGFSVDGRRPELEESLVQRQCDGGGGSLF